MQRYMYEHAPNAILERIAQFRAMRRKAAEKKQDNPQVKFIDEVLADLSLAYAFMRETYMIRDRNELLEGQIAFFSKQFARDRQLISDLVGALYIFSKHKEDYSEDAKQAVAYVEKVLELYKNVGILNGDEHE